MDYNTADLLELLNICMQRMIWDLCEGFFLGGRTSLDGASPDDIGVTRGGGLAWHIRTCI